MMERVKNSEQAQAELGELEGLERAQKTQKDPALQAEEQKAGARVLERQVSRAVKIAAQLDDVQRLRSLASPIIPPPAHHYVPSKWASSPEK